MWNRYEKERERERRERAKGRGVKGATDRLRLTTSIIIYQPLQIPAAQLLILQCYNFAMDNDGKMEKLTVPALRPLTLLCIISMHFNAFYQFLLVAPVHFCIRGSERCMCRCGHRTMAFSGLLGGDFPRKLCIDGIAARPYREESSSCTASWVLGVL